LPKGKLDAGEEPVLGGVREVHEETGFAAVPGRTLGVSRYRVLDRGRDVAKTVQWWAMQAGEGEFVPNAEVDALRWLPVPTALARVSSGYDCAPLTAFAQERPDTTTVLLVRHAAAGTQADFGGPDDVRPLDQAGRRQAAALAATLPVYRPQRVLAAPLARCVDTVRPLADRLGVQLEPDAAAAEAENDPKASALVQLLTELASTGTTTVVCSQGGAIPAAVAALTGQTGVPARKGSLWALSFDGRAVVDAAYTASFGG
jgi:phosphohistidine phosphatase SixA